MVNARITLEKTGWNLLRWNGKIFINFRTMKPTKLNNNNKKFETNLLVLCGEIKRSERIRSSQSWMWFKNGVLQDEGHASLYEQECSLYSSGREVCPLLLMYDNTGADSRNILLWVPRRGGVNHFFCAAFQSLRTRSTEKV